MTTTIVAAAYGGPEVLTVLDAPTPEPGPGEIRIEVRAAGVNPIDFKTYSGMMGSDPTQLPKHLGAEAAGVVTAVGPDANGPAGPVEVGDEVIAYPANGAYASEIVVPASSAVPKPVEVDWDVAGGLLVSGVTAVHAIEATGVRAGDVVLVHGASGGVGLIVVQLAVARGATVVATASAARYDRLRELGALPVTYGAGLADRVREIAPDGVDVALDLVGSDEAVDVSLELVADKSRIATIAAFGRAGDDGIKLLGGGPGADPGTDIRAAARQQLTAAVADGSLTIFIARTYPLEQAAEAHREISTGHTSGKIVLRP